MITPTRECAQPADWRATWRDSVSDARELLGLLNLGHLAARLPAKDAGFAVRVPRGFVARMRPGDAHDPLLLQVLPQLAELDQAPGYSRDAVGELPAQNAGNALPKGVLHKYSGRVLAIASGACAINCRYCFRRHFPYAESIAAAAHWRSTLDYLQQHPDIEELILSGGDPLSLTTAKLAELDAPLARLQHVRRLRIHTRMPVVLPERIDTAFCKWLNAVPLQRVVVLHANHARELNNAVADACARLRDAGATVLNQSVLLRGVNDDADTLAKLSERLFECGVLPYYLHQLDRVQGAAHFEVADDRARALHDTLRSRLPGFLVPRLVREEAGMDSKTPV